MNNRIRVPQVRVIDENDKQLGVLETHIALNIARDRGLDLVEVSPSANPPVCRIIDYGKFKYEQRKKEAIAKKKQIRIVVKEVKVGIATQDHDLSFKADHIRKFLSKGERVKVSLWFKGREIAHPELGRVILNKVIAKIKDIGQIERTPSLMGKVMSMFIIPIPGVGKKRGSDGKQKVEKAKDQNEQSNSKAV